ncbi:MAG: DUF748 domain-containing protein, partial [Pseudomonas sp.]
ALHLADLQLHGSDVRVLIDSHGNLNLSQLLLPNPDNSTDSATEDAGAQEPFPVRIERLKLLHSKLYFRDQQPSEPVTFSYDSAHLELQHLSTLAGEDAELSLTASGPDGAKLDWQGSLSLNPLVSSGHLSVGDTALQIFWPYVSEQLPLKLGRGYLDLSSNYQLQLADTLQLQLDNASLNLQDLDLQDPEGAPLLQLQRLELGSTQLDLADQRIRIGTVLSSDLEAWISRDANAELNWSRLLETRSPPAEEPVKAPWRVLVDQAQLNNHLLHLQDQKPETDVELELGPLSMTLSQFDSQGESPFSLRLDSAVGQHGRITADGEAGINPPNARLDVNTRNLDLRLAQAYLAPFVRIELRSGRLDSALDVALAGIEPLDLSITGSATVNQLHVLDTIGNRDLLKWEALQLSGIDYGDNQLAIESAALRQPYGRFIINQDLSTNIDELIIQQPDPEQPSSDAKPLAVRVGSVDIDDGSANFADLSLRPPFGTAIEQLNGRIGTLDNQSKTPAEIDLAGNVDRYAPVTIKGKLTPFDPLNSLDINASFRNVELTTLTPYSTKFAGYRIRKGRLNLDLHYQIEQGRLTAENKVLLEDLQLGERVDSPDAVDLPVRLAVALLKDSRGNIDIALPLRGDLNNPDFSIMPIVWQTLGNLMQRAVQAPFKMLAGLVSGAGDTDISRIGFQPGSAELDEQARQALDTLASALTERPNLLLEVEGMSAPTQDGQLLGAQRLEREFQQRSLRQLQERGEAVPEDASQLVVAEEDKSAMLQDIYQARLKQDIPEAWQALPAEERERNMRQALIDQWAASTAILRRLAQQRNDAIKAYLVDSANLEASRVYLLDVGTQAEAEDDRVFSNLHLGSQ